jgi:hypothetical protein
MHANNKQEWRAVLARRIPETFCCFMVKITVGIRPCTRSLVNAVMCSCFEGFAKGRRGLMERK